LAVAVVAVVLVPQVVMVVQAVVAEEPAVQIILVLIGVIQHKETPGQELVTEIVAAKVKDSIIHFNMLEAAVAVQLALAKRALLVVLVV
jgi:hypothetical protein